MSRMHTILTLGVVGTLVAAVVAQLPELRRYLKMRSM